MSIYFKTISQYKCLLELSASIYIGFILKAEKM
jgi:hypothetical protein